jgi:excisionase family DNA binding protein
MGRKPIPWGATPSELLTTQELADYLRINERTVLKLASLGELPGVRLGSQWRFRRTVIDAWLHEQALGSSLGSPPITDVEPATFGLGDFKREHVLATLEGRTLARVLEELSTHAHALGLVRDKTWFLGALIERENVLSSAVGSGVALPHTLERHPEQVRVPFLLLGRSVQGVDFDAPDDLPVRIVVVMGLRHQTLHLPWLKRLTELLQLGGTRQEILDAPGEEAIWQVCQRRLAS